MEVKKFAPLGLWLCLINYVTVGGGGICRIEVTFRSQPLNYQTAGHFNALCLRVAKFSSS